MQRQAAALSIAVLTLALFATILAPVAVAASLTVSTDKDAYEPGETVLITIVVEDNTTSATVAVTVYDPAGTLVYTDQLNVNIANGTGTASTSFVLPSDAKTGNWLVKAQYGSISAEDAFQVGNGGSGSSSGSAGTGGGSTIVGAAFVAMAFIALAISLNRSKSPSRSRKR